MRFQLAFTAAQLALNKGRIDEAQQLANELRATWPASDRSVQEALIQVAELGLALARGGSQSWALAESVLASPFRPLHSAYGATIANFCAFACVDALRRGALRASPRRVRQLARIALNGPPAARPGGLRALAYLESHFGRNEGAIQLLRESEALATRLALPGDVAFARYRRGERTPGEEGRTLRADACAALAAIGVSEKVLLYSSL